MLSGVELYTGTSGFSYDAWKGRFYPEGLPAKRRLAFYAERLSAVEINNTFYRMPRRSVVEGWAAEVPEGFRFAVKASQRITHKKRLKEVDEEMGYLLGALEGLGTKLGVLLFQLPPYLRGDPERLDRFLALLPEATPAAFEFRHPSWEEPAIHERLRARGVALVRVDADEAEPPALPARDPLVYLRLRRSDYDDAALAAWAERLRATDAERAFVFLKHEDAAVGPRAAARLRALFEEGVGSAGGAR